MNIEHIVRVSQPNTGSTQFLSCWYKDKLQERVLTQDMMETMTFQDIDDAYLAIEGVRARFPSWKFAVWTVGNFHGSLL